MLRFIGSLSQTHSEALRRVLSQRLASNYGPQRTFCSSTQGAPEQPVILFRSPSSIVGIYRCVTIYANSGKNLRLTFTLRWKSTLDRLIGLSVYSQVVASCIYVQQMLFPSTPSKYSWGVQLVRPDTRLDPVNTLFSCAPSTSQFCPIANTEHLFALWPTN